LSTTRKRCESGRFTSSGSAPSTALAVFYNPTADIDAHDFYDTAVDDTIRIMVSYTDLTDTERAAFSKYVHSDELTVEKRIHWDADRQKAVQAYYGFTLQHPPFTALRDPSTPFNARRAHYNTLRSQPGYATLPAAVQSDVWWLKMSRHNLGEF
jgi:hypothetical protein